MLLIASGKRLQENLLKRLLEIAHVPDESAEEFRCVQANEMHRPVAFKARQSPPLTSNSDWPISLAKNSNLIRPEEMPQEPANRKIERWRYRGVPMSVHNV